MNLRGKMRKGRKKSKEGEKESNTLDKFLVRTPPKYHPSIEVPLRKNFGGIFEESPIRSPKAASRIASPNKTRYRFKSSKPPMKARKVGEDSPPEENKLEEYYPNPQISKEEEIREMWRTHPKINIPLANSGAQPETEIISCRGREWIYPAYGERIREYQFRIIVTALYNNTLICLPTGLGKTFIGAAVMYNYYRWFPSGLIIFVSPTKPLVKQQVIAFIQYTGIDSTYVLDATGNGSSSMNPTLRTQKLIGKRVVFATPQIIANDISQGRMDPRHIICFVVDEAHRATGNYAYCKIVSAIEKGGAGCRIIGLTATPGSTLPAIQEVLYIYIYIYNRSSQIYVSAR